MKIVFMGTPDFAAASLEKLVSSGYDLPLVITQPDKPRGRGMEIAFSAVKKLRLTTVWFYISQKNQHS